MKTAIHGFPCRPHHNEKRNRHLQGANAPWLDGTKCQRPESEDRANSHHQDKVKRLNNPTDGCSESKLRGLGEAMFGLQWGQNLLLERQ